MDKSGIVSRSSDAVDKHKSTRLLRFRSMPGEAEEEAKVQLERREGQVEEFTVSLSYTELLGIDGEAIEFEWNMSQDSRNCRFFSKSR